MNLNRKAHGGVTTPRVQEYELPNVKPGGTKREGKEKKGVRKRPPAEEHDAQKSTARCVELIVDDSEELT